MQLDSFYNYLRYEKRFSEHTLKSYQNDIEQFSSFLEEKELHHASVRDVRFWVIDLMKNNASTTVNRKLSALKSYYRFLQKKEVIKLNPAKNISTLKESSRTPQFVSEKEITQVLENLPKPDDYISHRNRLIFEIFYATGVRREELINLSDKSIDFANQHIVVVGKGKKERKIPVHIFLLEKIKVYLNVRNEHFGLDKYPSLFLTEKEKQMRPKDVYNIVKSFLEMCLSVEKKSPHILRHTFATHMLNNGADLNAIKELLGHSSLAATQVYTHNSIDRLKEIHKQAHPKA